MAAVKARLPALCRSVRCFWVSWHVSSRGIAQEVSDAAAAVAVGYALCRGLKRVEGQQLCGVVFTGKLIGAPAAAGKQRRQRQHRSNCERGADSSMCVCCVTGAMQSPRRTQQVCKLWVQKRHVLPAVLLSLQMQAYNLPVSPRLQHGDGR
jgi:hypothetical protein